MKSIRENLSCTVLNFIFFMFSIFSIPTYADNQITTNQPAKPNKTETTRLEKIIFPEFEIFKPKIIDSLNLGNLTVVHLSVAGADHNDAFVIITPDNKLIDIDNYALLSNIDIKKNSNYTKLAENFPNISIWPGNHNYPNYKKLADNTQQLQFNYNLLNGCHACAIGGVANIGFNFDSNGQLLGITLLELSAPPVVSS